MAGPPNPEDLGEPALEAAGFQLWVHGRQFPESTDYWDGNWLRVTALCRAPGANVWVSGALLAVPDLLRWADETEKLLRGSATESHLEPHEPNLSAVIRRVESRAPFGMRVSITPSVGEQEHTFELPLDPGQVESIARSCRRIIAIYPVVGEPPSPS
jgi:hypothetical protein